MTKEELKNRAKEFVSEIASGTPQEMDYYTNILVEFANETTKELEKENAELKEKLNKATEILKVVLNKWKEERWILQSEKEVKMIENVMKEAEAF